MATAGVPLWSTTASSNATADPAVNFAEGQAPSSVNDSARALMASVANWRNDLYGITTGGTSTAYTIATGSTFATAAAMSGVIFTIIPHATSGASPTLSVDGLTARAINASTGVAVPTGGLIAGTPYLVKYVHASTEFIVLNSFSSLFPNGTVGAPSIAFASDSDSGLYRIGANNVGLAVNGTKILDVATTGLAVTGTLSSSGAMTVTSGGLTVTAGGLTVTDGGLTVTAGSVAFPAGSIASTALATVFTRGTAQATTSGSSIDFTSIPATVTQITVTFSAVSLTSGATSPIQIQIGDSGGIETTGYQSHGGFFSGSNTGVNFASTGGFALTNNITAGVDVNGSFTLTLVDASTNTWAGHGVVATSAAGYYSGGSKSLSATLDRIRITAGSDTFDAGKVNIVYV